MLIGLWSGLSDDGRRFCRIFRVSLSFFRLSRRFPANPPQLNKTQRMKELKVDRWCSRRKETVRREESQSHPSKWMTWNWNETWDCVVQTCRESLQRLHVPRSDTGQVGYCSQICFDNQKRVSVCFLPRDPTASKYWLESVSRHELGDLTLGVKYILGYSIVWYSVETASWTRTLKVDADSVHLDWWNHH